MDKIDRHILEVLQKEARLSTAELSERIGCRLLLARDA
ncbi:AsnC family transcriptional regulator [Psychrobacter sp. JCM 18900]